MHVIFFRDLIADEYLVVDVLAVGSFSEHSFVFAPALHQLLIA